MEPHLADMIVLMRRFKRLQKKKFIPHNEGALNGVIIPRLPEGGGGYTVLPLSFRLCKIFFVAFFSVTVDGRNLIFGHKRHIGIPYCG